MMLRRAPKLLNFLDLARMSGGSFRDGNRTPEQLPRTEQLSEKPEKGQEKSMLSLTGRYI